MQSDQLGELEIARCLTYKRNHNVSLREVTTALFGYSMDQIKI